MFFGIICAKKIRAEHSCIIQKLWAKGKVDDFIPVELVEPVSEVLKWVKSLEDARREEEELDSIEID